MRLLLALLVLCPAFLRAAEVRTLPWRLPFGQGESNVVDGYLTEPFDDEAQISLILPNQQRVPLPFRTDYAALQRGPPLIAGEVWREGRRYQVHLRTLSEDWLRQVQVEFRSPQRVHRAGWSSASLGRILQIKRWGDQVWAHQLGPAPGGFGSDSHSVARLAETPFLVPPPIPFSWHLTAPAVEPPSGAVDVPTAGFTRLHLDGDRLLWSVISQAGMHPRQIWDLALVVNPTWRNELYRGLGGTPSLATLYRALGALGPATQWVMFASSEALAWWERCEQPNQIRRELLAGCWLAMGYMGLPRPVTGGMGAPLPRWDQIVSGRVVRSSSALRDTLQSLSSVNPAELLPVTLGRQSEVYYATFIQLSRPTAPPFLWVDFWAPEQYRPQQPEETVELQFRDKRFIEALENLPWFGPS